MSRKLTTIKDQKEQIENNFTWLKATYHFHVFHYRMPESVAIASITSFVPSPLTIKMAMIASLFQIGEDNVAKILAKRMDSIETKIVPPKFAISFKAFLKYRSPPAVESEKGLNETGSYYPSRPHIREYVIFQDNLEIYIKSPENLKEIIEKSIKNVRYLGAKDSIVSCIEVLQVDEPSKNCISKLDDGQSGVVVLLADFKSNIQNVEEILPGKRKEEMFEKIPYVLPGRIKTKGRTKIFEGK